MDENVLKIDPKAAELAAEIVAALAALRPEKSLSFVLSPEGKLAVEQAISITDWGIGGNKPKLKETALENLSLINNIEAGHPVNVNLTDYEIKAMGEVLDVIRRVLENHQNGIVKK